MLFLFCVLQMCHAFQNPILPTRKATDLSSTSLFAKSKQEDRQQQQSRRGLLGNALTLCASAILSTTTSLQPAHAVVTEETNTFADTWWDPSSNKPNNKPPPTTTTACSRNANTNTPSDEIVISLTKKDLQAKGGLGIELAEIEFRTNIRVYVKTVLPNSLAEKLGIQKDWIVVSVNGQSAERTNAEGVTLMVSKVVKTAANPEDTLVLRFRDNNYFKDTLQTPGALAPNQPLTTQVAPAGDTTQRNADGSIRVGTVTSQVDQKITVEQLIPPKMCNRGAATDDLLEISYLGTVLETGAIFDGSAIKIQGKAIPGVSSLPRTILIDWLKAAFVFLLVC